MKGYTQVRPDLADTDAVAAEVTANPGQYIIGTIIIPADGTFHYVSAVGAITSLEPLPPEAP